MNGKVRVVTVGNKEEIESEHLLWVEIEIAGRIYRVGERYGQLEINCDSEVSVHPRASNDVWIESEH